MQDSSEAGPFNLGQDIKAVWAWKWSVLLSVFLAGLSGLLIASLLNPVYESEVGILVGRVSGGAIEDPYALARYLESKAFASQIPSQHNKPGASVRIEVVEGAGGQRAPVYVSVTARGRTSEEARALANYVVEASVQRHRSRFDAMTRQYTEYTSTLEHQIQGLTQEIDRSETMLKALSKDDVRSVGTPALLLQAQQMVSKQELLLTYAKELRDTRIHHIANTQPTSGMAPPTPSAAPIWPRRPVIAVITAGLAFAIAVASILLIPAFRRGSFSRRAASGRVASTPQLTRHP